MHAGWSGVTGPSLVPLLLGQFQASPEESELNRTGLTTRRELWAGLRYCTVQLQRP